VTRPARPARRVWPPETYEHITVQREGNVVTVLSAPLISLISLELLTVAERARFEVHGDVVTIAKAVDYQVIGWDRDARALIVRRVADRRYDESTETANLRRPEGIPPKGDTPS
jgi:hypothetical protein